MLYKAFFNLYDGEIVAEIQKVTMSSGGSDESREIESIVLKISCEGRASAQSGTNYIVFVLIFVINTILLLRNILLQVLPMVVWLLQLLCRLSQLWTGSCLSTRRKVNSSNYSSCLHLQKYVYNKRVYANE